MLSKFFRKRPRPVDFPPPAPETVVEIIGDVHGCIHLLEKLPPVEKGATRVFVGDYVDRGPDSKAALEYVFARSREGAAICLGGNHEEMFLSFLDRPDRMRAWLRHGGLQTLASFGIGGVTEGSPPESLEKVANDVRAKLSVEILDWLEELPCLWTSGTLHVVHAAMAPDLPVHAQSREVMTWGHRDFRTVPRKDGQWVAHGHTIVEEPRAENGVISADTGAYATGRLTIARVAPDGVVSFEYVTG